MKIDKQDWERVMNELDKNTRVHSRYILDLPKYKYWAKRSEEFIDKMNENKDDKDKYCKYYREALLCELEKNIYCRLTRKEFILLYTLLKYHNSINPENKVYMNDKGQRVKFRRRNQ